MQRKFLLCAVVSLITHHHASLADAFAVFSVYSSATSSPVRASMTALFSHSSGLFDEEGDFFDVESARRELENLIVAGGNSFDKARPEEPSPRPMLSTLSFSESDISALRATPNLDVNLPVRPPLTTIERERRSAEIAILAHLSNGDDVLSDIWNLWFSERGPRAEALLRTADDLIDNDPEGWDEAEQILRALIEVHGVYFTEPLNCLATLYLLQGKLNEALTLNQMVLAVKPWHPSALSHIVMVYAGLGENRLARKWAEFRLPKSTMIRRRTRWVEKAVVDATILLHQSEKRLASSFGEPDKVWIQKQLLNQLHIDSTSGSDSWQ
jgi:hypothetical protein